VRVDGGGSAQLAPGQAATVQALVSPNVSGPVTVEVQQFDPLEGWQFVRAIRGSASGGRADVPFVPPTPGRWRATVKFDGTREIAPSEAGHFVPILVGGALQE
jgi:hypothetical protein